MIRDYVLSMQFIVERTDVQSADTPRFTLAELVEATGVSERTIRYYINEGILSSAFGRGRARYYTPEHLEQLEQVRQLRDQRLSIEEIRDRMTRPVTVATPARETWQRINLHPDLELLVRSDAPQAVHALAREVVEVARQWFGDDEQ